MISRSWPPWAVTSLERQLDALVEAVATQGDRSDDEQMWLTRFLVVRTCGYLEQVVHETVVEYVRSCTGGAAQSFALSWMVRSRNPSPDNLLEIVGRFDAARQDELESLLDLDDGYVRRELSLLVNRRHHIAHGVNEGLGTRKALDLVVVAKGLADWFIREFNPDKSQRRRALPVS